MEISTRTIEFINNTETFCDKYQLLKASDIIVGLSGGADSTALLIVLKELTSKRGINLHAIHINHLLRGVEADKDEALSKELCERLDVPFKAFKLDVKGYAEEHKVSLETAGRIIRYQQFDLYSEEILKVNSKAVVRIAVAHHANDLAETFLMNLFRGSGLEGLCSPRPVFKNIIRPFLFTDKASIVSFLEENNIEYAVDSTNNELCCTRNGWRNTVLPSIREVSVKDPISAVSSTYSLLYEDLKYIQSEVDRIYNDNSLEINGHRFLMCNTIADKPLSIASRLIRKLWQDTFDNLIDFEQTHLNIVLDFVKTNGHKKSLSTIQLSFARKCFVFDKLVGFCDSDSLLSNVELIVASHGFVLCDESMRENFLIASPEIPHLSIPFVVQKIENDDNLEYNNLSWFLPIFEKEEGKSLVVTNRIRDLKFTRAGSSSSKKLSDALCDRYVPSIVRDNVVGITDTDGKLLWVPGVGHSRGFVDECSRQKMMEEYKEKPLYFCRISFKE